MTQILQLLVTIASTLEGSSALLAAKSWPQLLKAIPEHSLALDVVKYTFLAAVHPSLEHSLYWDKLDGTLFTLVDSFKDPKDFTLFFECLNRILTASPARVSKLFKNFIAVALDDQTRKIHYLLDGWSLPLNSFKWRASVAKLRLQRKAGRLWCF